MTGEAEDDFYAEVFLDDRLPHVTAEALTAALDGFALRLLPAWEMVSLARAVRRGLGVTVRDHPDRPRPVDVRKELVALGHDASATWLRLFTLSDAADSALWQLARVHWTKTAPPGCVEADFPDLKRFRAAVRELDWASGFLRRAAEVTAQESPHASRRRPLDLKVERGRFLAPIYEAAFGTVPTANGYPYDARHTRPTPFMEFYRRVARLAFPDEDHRHNFSRAMKSACRHHKRSPVIYNAAVLRL